MLSDAQRETLISLAAQYGTEEEDGGLRTEYRWNAMHDRTCPAIVTDRPIGLVEHAAANGIFGAKINRIGVDFVVYWPNL